VAGAFRWSDMSFEPDESISETEREIMEATFEALIEHGYADVSISKIAAHFSKSQSLLYYHYENKDEIMVSFLQFALDEFFREFDPSDGGRPAEDMNELIEYMFPSAEADTERTAFLRIFVELRSQAISNGTFMEIISDIDAQLVVAIEEILARGVEAGTYACEDTHRTAQFVYAVVSGSMLLETTSEGVESDAVRTMLRAYLDSI
jgi:AcrR family transcriptional regulator